MGFHISLLLFRSIMPRLMAQAKLPRTGMGHGAAQLSQVRQTATKKQAQGAQTLTARTPCYGKGDSKSVPPLPTACRKRSVQPAGTGEGFEDRSCTAKTWHKARGTARQSPTVGTPGHTGCRVNIDGSKKAVTKMGHFYFGAGGRYYSGANTHDRIAFPRHRIPSGKRSTRREPFQNVALPAGQAS